MAFPAITNTGNVIKYRRFSIDHRTLNVKSVKFSVGAVTD